MEQNGISAIYVVLISAGVSGFFVLLVALLNPIITNWINVKTENRNIKRGELKEIKEKRKDFHNAYLDLLKLKAKILTILYLVKEANDFDVLRIRHQIEDVNSEGIFKLNENISLNNEELHLAKELFYVDTVENIILTNLEILESGKLSKALFVEVIKHVSSNLIKLENAIIKYFSK